LSPSLHIGVVASLALGNNNFNTSIGLFPHVKFLLEGDVNPYFIVGLAVGSVEGSDAVMSLDAGFGLEYFATENVGLFGDITIFSYGLNDPNSAVFGVTSGGRAGVEWFFDR
jgi:hypothetical protein